LGGCDDDMGIDYIRQGSGGQQSTDRFRVRWLKADDLASAQEPVKLDLTR
jgi:hypothetical protein